MGDSRGVLAIWAAFTATGWMSALLETFLVIGLIAAVVVIAVSLVAKRRRPG
jgi:subtilase family serine protease